MLASVHDLGYSVEWRVVNAAKYGFPQKRRRVFIVGVQVASPKASRSSPPAGSPRRASSRGHSRQLPTATRPAWHPDGAPWELADITETFGRGLPVTPFRNAGVMVDRKVWTTSVTPTYDGPFTSLGDILEPESDVPEAFFIPEDQLEQWQYLKGAKKEERHHRSGAAYFYTEGAIPYPDNLDDAARTILTGEGGISPSRFKHIIPTPSGRDAPPDA